MTFTFLVNGKESLGLAIIPSSSTFFSPRIEPTFSRGAASLAEGDSVNFASKRAKRPPLWIKKSASNPY